MLAANHRGWGWAPFEGAHQDGADGGTRTLTLLRAPGFEPGWSTIPPRRLWWRGWVRSERLELPWPCGPRGSEPRVSAVPPRARTKLPGTNWCAWGDSNSQWGISPPAPQAGVSALPPQARRAATGTRAPLSCLPSRRVAIYTLAASALGGTRTRNTALRRRGPDPNLDEDDVLAARFGLATLRL